MTCDVIDTMTSARCAGCMLTTTRPAPRLDRTLRAVMWMDAFLSVAFVGVGLVASPIVATLGVPSALRTAVGVGTFVAAVLLALFGAITAVAFMLRMRDGEYFPPPHLRLPLPDGMRPTPWSDGRTGVSPRT